MAHLVKGICVYVALVMTLSGYTNVSSAQQRSNYIVKFQELSLVEQLAQLPSGQVNTRSATTGRMKLDMRSSIAQNKLAELRAVQDQHIVEIERLLERQIPLTYRYDAAINGVAISLSATEAAQISSLNFVKWVQQERIDVLGTDRGPEFIGA